MKTAPSKRTLRGLDAVNFLMADVHTGVGPFVAIYLAASLHWNPKDIGVALSFGKTLVVELAPRGIRVNVLSPGPVETPILGKLGLPAEAQKGFEEANVAKSLLKRFAGPRRLPISTASCFPTTRWRPGRQR